MQVDLKIDAESDSRRGSEAPTGPSSLTYAKIRPDSVFSGSKELSSNESSFVTALQWSESALSRRMAQRASKKKKIDSSKLLNRQIPTRKGE